MKTDKNTLAEAAELRRLAEERLREKRKSQRSEVRGLPAIILAKAGQRTEEETQRLHHELQVHQIELEMQNEELRQSRAEVEAGLERYKDLYDFAPVGYFTLDRNGAISQVNLTGARLLGVERARLVNRRFGLFVSDDSRPAFAAFLQKVF
ncbi:MAG: PAS domain-containing protein [candidate division NC10 bacterium]